MSTTPTSTEATVSEDHRRGRRRGWTVLVVATIVAISSLTSSLAAVAIVDFTDVPDGHPFEDDIDWLSHLGITEGYADGTFRPGDPVTRGSMAAFLHRFHAIDDTVFTTTETEGATIISNTSWQALPGSLTEFVIPDGTGARLLATFSAESLCTGVAGFCQARIMIDDPATGWPGPEELAPEAGGFAFDSTDGGTAVPGSWRSLSMQRTGSGRTPSSTWTAWVEIRTTQDDIEARLDDWLLSVLVDVQGLNT